MRAILIDPKARTVTKIDSPLRSRDLRKLLQCSTFDVVRLGVHDDLFVDDEGMLRNPSAFFRIRGYGAAIAGRAVLCRHDSDGHSAPATWPLKLVRSLVSFEP